MNDKILHKIIEKYSRKGKFTLSGAIDVRMLCETIDELIGIIRSATIKIPNNSIAADLQNKMGHTMLVLENRFNKHS